MYPPSLHFCSLNYLRQGRTTRSRPFRPTKPRSRLLQPATHGLPGRPNHQKHAHHRQIIPGHYDEDLSLHRTRNERHVSYEVKEEQISYRLYLWMATVHLRPLRLRSLKEDCLRSKFAQWDLLTFAWLS
jgi:hypothetical protein